MYELTYYDDNIPVSNYKISIYEKIIKIQRIDSCSSKDNIEKYQYKYSQENMNKIKKFLDNLDPNILSQSVILPEDLSEYQKNVIMGIIYGDEYYLETVIEEYEYKIEYSATNNLSYDIFFKEDNKIIVKKLTINNDYDITAIDTYELNFSLENMQILKEYVEKLSNEQNSKIIQKTPTLYKDERNFILSIIENDESYLIDREQVEITYKISYKGINCLTPILILYKDGTYNYDSMAYILGSISEENTYNITLDYSITDNDGNTYHNYDKERLSEFLNDNNIELMTCLE